MAKPPVIEDKQIEHLLKATAAYSRVPLRDTALLLTLYGTAMSVTELATITIGDYLDAYLAWRVERKHGVTVKKGAYRGLDPESALFLTEDGGSYALTKRKLPSGVWSYSCNTLGAYISRVHANAGIEGGSAQSARRTFAVKQHRQGRDLVHIAAILGHKSVSTTKRLVEGDPVRLADIVARAV